MPELMIEEDNNEPVVYTRLELKKMQDTVGNLMTNAEAIRMKHQGQPEGMTGQEDAEYVRMVEDAHKLKPKIEAAMKYLAIKNWSSGVASSLAAGGPSAQANDAQLKAAEHFSVFREYLRGQNKQKQSELEQWVYKQYQVKAETKAYQADNPAGGGFAVMPQQMVHEFITLMKDLVFMRPAATVYQVPTAESLGVPAIDADPSDSDWTVELGVGSEETTAAVGKREFRPHPVAKYIKMSKKLLRQVPNIETVLMDRLAYKMAITEEKAFISGSGADQPLGVFIANANGISTARDTAAASSTVIAADDIIGLFYGLKAQYRARSNWMMNRSVILLVRKLKDTTNNYLWTSGYGNQTGNVSGPGGGMQGTPDTLMGRPVWESEYAPNTVTSGLYTMVVGDFSRYWIADALDMQLQVLYELFALSNQMGYILRKETDGLPVLEEAFARLKMA